MPVEHTQDSDCRVDPETDLCRDCGALHGAPCYHCGARAFHKPGCLFVFAGRGEVGPIIKRGQRKTVPRIPRESPANQPKFVAVDRSVMRGKEHICTAVSTTFARRIARALNHHIPDSRGI
jgi:hypothetical protein